LLPFRTTDSDDPTTFWNSDQSRTSDAFGYTYPDVVGTGQKVKDEFGRKYIWSVPLKNALEKVKAPEDMKPLDFTKSEFCTDFKAPAIASQAPPAALVQRLAIMTETKSVQLQVAKDKFTEDAYSYEWFVDDRVER
jgi:hypothetical protein